MQQQYSIWIVYLCSLWMNDSNEHKSPLISFKLSLCITRVCSTYVSHRYHMQVHPLYETHIYVDDIHSHIHTNTHSHWILKYLALSMLANLFAWVGAVDGCWEWMSICLPEKCWNRFCLGPKLVRLWYFGDGFTKRDRGGWFMNGSFTKHRNRRR